MKDFLSIIGFLAMLLVSWIIGYLMGLTSGIKLRQKKTEDATGTQSQPVVEEEK